MSKLKIINQEELKDWAKEVFKKNSFNMVETSTMLKEFFLNTSFAQSLSSS